VSFYPKVAPCIPQRGGSSSLIHPSKEGDVLLIGEGPRRVLSYKNSVGQRVVETPLPALHKKFGQLPEIALS
jgi:hypothetical protein